MANQTPPLFEFLDTAKKCAEAARVDNTTALSRCADLDAFIGRSTSDRLDSPLAAILRLSSRAMFCSSINTALIGYRAGLFPTLRACLEAACYAQEIESKPHLAEVWLKRQESPEAHKKCRRAFGEAVKATCKRLSKRMPDNAGLVSQMYDSMIDRGAHPNVRSILPCIRMTETDTHHEVAIDFVVPGDVEASLFCCYEIGLFTSWLLGDLEKLDEPFWEEASRLNDIKNTWEQELIEKKQLRQQ